MQPDHIFSKYYEKGVPVTVIHKNETAFGCCMQGEANHVLNASSVAQDSICQVVMLKIEIEKSAAMKFSVVRWSVCWFGFSLVPCLLQASRSQMRAVHIAFFLPHIGCRMPSLC